MKTEPTTLTVLPPERSPDPKSATVALMQEVALSPENSRHLAAQIQADMDAHERMSRDAALIALRIGLRLIWIRDNAAHGTLQQFTDTYFANKSRRTLFNYIRLGDVFLTEAGLRDKKTHKLTGKALEQVAPICAVQLELFSDPQARLEGALKKVIKWVGDRGLAQIYRDLEAAKEKPMPPKTGKGGRPALDSITPAMRREAALEQGHSLHVFFEGRSWEHLEDGELAELDTLLDKFVAGVRELIQARTAAAEAAAPRNRKGKA